MTYEEKTIVECLLMSCTSVNALQKLLFLSDENNRRNIHCYITNTTQRISYMNNGVEYYFVEVTCDDGIQYGIHAYSDEAIELYKEANKYKLSEQPTINYPPRKLA